MHPMFEPRPRRRAGALAAAAGAVTAAVALLAACASGPSSTELDQLAAKVMNESFRDQGIAKVDRIKQDLAQAACSSATPPDAATAERIMAEARAGVKLPAGGLVLGDWREGEKLAQSGRGMTWSDASARPADNGGNCYNCHRISAEEISFGTIGPSLFNYGKNRGITGTDSPSYKPIYEYTWTKLWNPRSFAACSQMPRFGHAGLLDDKQMRDLMALLLDPRSPVNR